MSAPSRSAWTGKSAMFCVIVLAGIVLAFALAKEGGLIDGSLAKRAVGMLIGAVLVVTGNALPKFVLPMSLRRQNSISTVVAERIAGWTFVLTGVAQIVIWIFAPLEHVMLISSMIGLAAFLSVFAIAAWLAWGEHSSTRPVAPTSQHDSALFHQVTGNRIAVLLILHAILWVFAIFLADSIWGDRVAQWMAVAFAIMNGLVISFVFARGWLSE